MIAKLGKARYASITKNSSYFNQLEEGAIRAYGRDDE